MKKDLNQVAKIEKAISEKYGKEAIQNPKSNWTTEKEQTFLEDLRVFYGSQKSETEERVEEKEGFVIVKKANKKEVKRICPVCGNFSFSARDDVYMNKYECCENCYYQFVDGREERWKSGWRPNK